MKVKEARRTASEWVKEAAAPHEEFVGAYLSGSTVDLTEDADLPPASDVDIMVVTSREEPPGKLGKFLYQGVLLEVTHLPLIRLASAESVLADYHLAGGFRRNTVIADPSGWLKELQRDVSRQFADRHWVRQRCLQALNKIRTGVQGLDPDASLPDLVNSWLFPAGITTHVLLAAALRNPTVRLRYPAANAVLREYGLEAVYPELLKLLGCETWTPHQASTHLEALSSTFDAAAAVFSTRFPFSADITPEARAVAIDGSWELIHSGQHREAVFWIGATFARCHKILLADSPALIPAHLPAFQAFLTDLGLPDRSSIISRSREVLASLPLVEATAERILEANRAISG